MTNLDFWWQQIIKLKSGERAGNEKGVVFCYEDYMLLESEEGAKKTSCLDAARFLAGIYEFKEVREI